VVVVPCSVPTSSDSVVVEVVVEYEKVSSDGLDRSCSGGGGCITEPTTSLSTTAAPFKEDDDDGGGCSCAKRNAVCFFKSCVFH
jgi:hypothetical protein